MLIVEAEVANDGSLRPGLFARAEIVIDDDTMAVTIPTKSTSPLPVLRKLWWSNGKALEKPITTRRRTGDWTEVTSGVKVGEMVVVEPGICSQAKPSQSWSETPMQKLAEVCIKRPIFAAMIILALVVVQAAAYFRLGVDRFPSVDLPTVRILTVTRGFSREIETQVSQRIEEAVNTVEGINELRSISGQGRSFVIVTFNLERDIDTAAQDVRDRVATTLRDLPPGTDPPLISKFSNDLAPVVTIALSSPNRSIRELTEQQIRSKTQLERSSGVGRCSSSAVSSGRSTSGSMQNAWRPTKSRSRPCAMPWCGRMPMCQAGM